MITPIKTEFLSLQPKKKFFSLPHSKAIGKKMFDAYSMEKGEKFPFREPPKRYCSGRDRQILSYRICWEGKEKKNKDDKRKITTRRQRINEKTGRC